MKKMIKWMILLFIILIITVFGINYFVKLSMKKYIVNSDYDNFDNIDCIIILGAGVWGDRPSPMLEDRLKMGISLYKDGIAPKIIMSGDHSRENYDEVNIMKNYAIEEGISSQDIFMDHAGFSTYDSIYRARDIFEAKKVVIVSQRYHLYRALYIAKSLGLDALGVAAEDIKYSGDLGREIREILARDKDFVKCIFKPKPTYLGESIPVSGDGDITNDKDDTENGQEV